MSKEELQHRIRALTDEEANARLAALREKILPTTQNPMDETRNTLPLELLEEFELLKHRLGFR